MGVSAFAPTQFSAVLDKCCYPWCGAAVTNRPVLPVQPIEQPSLMVVRAFWMCGSHAGYQDRLGSIAFDLKAKYETDTYAWSAPPTDQPTAFAGMQRTRVIVFEGGEVNRQYPTSACFFIVRWQDNCGAPPLNHISAQHRSTGDDSHPPPKRARQDQPHCGNESQLEQATQLF